MSGILTLNAGSSSLKFGLYRDAPDPVLLVHGQVDGIGNAARLIVEAAGDKTEDHVAAHRNDLGEQHGSDQCCLHDVGLCEHRADGEVRQP
ncbi:MAG: acetate kinase, partial [Pseudomonadota bacterium]